MPDKVCRHQGSFSLFQSGLIPCQPVKVDGHLERKERVEPLTDQPADHTREDVPCSARSHSRVSRGVDEDFSLGCGDERAVTFQDQIGPVGLRETPTQTDPIFQNLPGCQACHSAHLPWMGGEDEGSFHRWERFKVSCEGCEPIGIENNGKIERSDEFEDEGLRFLEGPHSGSDHHCLFVFTEANNGIESPEAKRLPCCFRKRFGHDFRQFDFHDRIETLRDTERDQAGTHAQGGFTGHGRRAGFSDRSRQDEEVAIISLVRVLRTRK